MKNPIKKILNVRSSLATYTLGLLQAKAYRILKTYTSRLLKEYELSTLDWALLGWLSDTKGGIQYKEIAAILGVEAPFVTVLVEELEKKLLLDVKVSEKDKRVKCVFLTDKAKKLVPKIEKELRQKTQNLVKGASHEEILSYKKVLETIVENDPTRF